MPDGSLSDRLRDFCALTIAERAQVDAEAAARPDLASAWDEARALAALVDHARQPDDLAARVVDERLGHGDLVVAPEAAQHRAALDRIAAQAEDPAVQFTRLTGHALPSPEPHRRNGHAAPNGTPLRLAADRPPERGATRRRLRRTVGVLVAVLALYGMAYGGSSLATPERARVADVDDVAETFRPVRSDQSDRYAAAVEALEGARRSTLGLFPRYDEAALAEAAEAFADIATGAPDDLYTQEAALALGRIRLLQGDDEAARTALDAVMAQSRTRASDAARLLDYLDEQTR